jgi:uncharacterized membrane protein YkoI
MSNTNRTFALLAGVAAVALTVATAGAQATAKHETQAQLKAEAKIPMATARATALSKVPGGSVKAGELERENGKLLYSFDIVTKGKAGIDEVQIDAITGAQIGSVVHETAKDEKKEAKAEAKEAKGAAKGKKGEAKAEKTETKKP